MRHDENAVVMFEEDGLDKDHGLATEAGVNGPA